ncbi:hypothetical protein GCM10027072_16350 [Streptomyces bullii]
MGKLARLYGRAGGRLPSNVRSATPGVRPGIHPSFHAYHAPRGAGSFVHLADGADAHRAALRLVPRRQGAPVPADTPDFLHATRTWYDAVAEAYTERFPDRPLDSPVGRPLQGALRTAFAGLARITRSRRARPRLVGRVALTPRSRVPWSPLSGGARPGPRP